MELPLIRETWLQLTYAHAVLIKHSANKTETGIILGTTTRKTLALKTLMELRPKRDMATTYIRAYAALIKHSANETETSIILGGRRRT